MSDTIQKLRDDAIALGRDFQAALEAATDAPALQALRDRFVGRRAGAVSGLLKTVPRLPEGGNTRAEPEPFRGGVPETLGRPALPLRVAALVGPTLHCIYPGDESRLPAVLTLR